MSQKVILLQNHRKDLIYGQEAIDFDFESLDVQDVDTLEGLFIHQLQSPLKLEDLILIEGTVKANGRMLTVDFYYEADNELAFHLNVRLDQNYVARNSFLEKQWGQEEGHGTTKNPIKKGEPFQLQIFILEKEYLVAANGQHLFTFEHRVPYNEVTKIEIFGDIELARVLTTHSGIYPDPKYQFKTPINSMTLPITYPFTSPLETGSTIVIKGRVKLLPLSFYINIQDGEQIYPHPKIMYHLNVRYLPESSLVENSWGSVDAARTWDQEVKSALPLLLAPGNLFTIYIAITDNGIRVYDAAWKLPQFPHRFDPSAGRCLHIQGDIVINSINIINNNEDKLDAK